MVFKSKEVVNLVNVKVNHLFDLTSLDNSISKLLSIPVMHDRSTVLGVVQLNAKPDGRQFSPWDVQLLTLLVSSLKAPTYSLTLPLLQSYLSLICDLTSSYTPDRLLQFYLQGGLLSAS